MLRKCRSCVKRLYAPIHYLLNRVDDICLDVVLSAVFLYHHCRRREENIPLSLLFCIQISSSINVCCLLFSFSCLFWFLSDETKQWPEVECQVAKVLHGHARVSGGN